MPLSFNTGSGHQRQSDGIIRLFTSADSMAAQRPPGPSSSFFGIPLARRMFQDYVGFHQWLHREHGDAVFMQLGRMHDYCFAHPDLVREALVEKGKSFIRWKYGMEVFSRAHGQSVLITEGTVWQRQRRMLQPVFGPKRFDGYAREVVAGSAAALDKLPVNQPMDFEHAMTMLTMDVIMRTMFSSQVPEDGVAASKAVRVLSRAGMKEMFLPFPLPEWVWLPWRPEANRARATLDTLVWRFIRQRQAEPGEHDDLLAMLMSAADEEGDQGRLDPQQVRDQCMTAFLAGHETTATALTWWGWAMASHPEIARRAAQEVDAALGGRAPVHADLHHLPYLAQTIKETLRMFPPAASLFTRQAIEDVQIGEWHIPKGSMVLVTPYVLHHDARWFENPGRFDPDRFSPERSERIPRGAYLPFGLGPRVCIGSNFAAMEMALIAAMLLQRFEFRPLPGQAAPRPMLNVTLRPADGMHLELVRRVPATSPARVEEPAPA
jgi:cytochrome P450